MFPAILRPRAYLLAMLLPTLLSGPVTPLHAEALPALTGYFTAPPVGTRLQIDGRPVQLSPKTQFNCDAVSFNYTIDNGVPAYPAGALLAVYGHWDKKLTAYRADSLCVLSLPEKSVSGEGVLDSITTETDASGKPTIWSLDGYQMRLPTQPADREKAIHFPKAAPRTGNAPAPGDWVQYAAARLPNGTLELRSAFVVPSVTGKLEPGSRNWKPSLFKPPANGIDGVLRPGLLRWSYTLPDDTADLKRLQRVGESVLPAWEKQLPSTDPRKRQFSFYLVASESHLISPVPQNDCLFFRNGVILTPTETFGRLDDVDLAAYLASCIAAVEEETSFRYDRTNAATPVLPVAASLALNPVLDGPLLAGVGARNAHIANLINAERARVSSGYLTAAGYPGSASATVWEKLNSKDGQVHLDRHPSPRAALAYRYLAEPAP